MKSLEIVDRLFVNLHLYNPTAMPKISCHNSWRIYRLIDGLICKRIMTVMPTFICLIAVLIVLDWDCCVKRRLRFCSVLCSPNLLVAQWKWSLSLVYSSFKWRQRMCCPWRQEPVLEAPTWTSKWISTFSRRKVMPFTSSTWRRLIHVHVSSLNVTK